MSLLESDTEKLRRRNRELEILNSIAEALNRPVDLDHSLQIALAQVAELLDLHTGWVFLLDENDEPYLAASQNLPPALAEHPEHFQGSCYCLDTYSSGDLNGAANVNVVRCSRLKWLTDGTEGLRYHSSIPLYAAGRKLGVMNVASTDWRELSADDLRLLYTIGDLLSIAIERARLFGQSVRFGAIEERNRLARELHDTLAQGLAAIALQLETAEALVESGADQDRLAQTIRKALEQTRANLEEARRSVLDLRTAPLEGTSLAEAVIAMVEQWRADHDIDIHLTISGGKKHLPARIEVGLYRIISEALANIARHSGAGHATMQLDARNDEVCLRIADDGTGFDPSEVQEGRYGLIGLNERVYLLGGRLDLQSEQGKGTELNVVIPL
jgi:two-component system NarL family sensor kinase